jgi:methyl-CpG-binding domain protein 4
MVATRNRTYEFPSNLSVRARTISLQTRKRTKTGPQRPHTIPTPPGFPFTLENAIFGLMQERIHTNLYALVVQAILWNQTHGLAARPVFFQLLNIYPTPLALSRAAIQTLTAILRPIGLQNIRAARLIALANVWVTAPPCKEKRYRKLHYPVHRCGADIGPREVLSQNDEREGWEIAHLPGVGRYALDSFRIFHRDRLRGGEGEGSFEPEWKRVLPQDKDLRAYLAWKWEQEGWRWDMLTGKRSKITFSD